MRRSFAIAVAVLSVVLSACGGATSSSPGASAAASLDPTKDKLAHILQRGTLVAYGTEDYAPQSDHVDGAVRPADTKCLNNQFTANEEAGFDIDTSKIIAEGLGVEICFVDPTWTEFTSGNWGDRYDIGYGSGAINGERMAHLWMTQPYYYIPQRYAVLDSSAAQTPSDLDGKKIGVCTGCTVESYLKGTLTLPGVTLEPTVKDPQLVGFEFEAPGLDSLAKGEIDSYFGAEPVLQAAIDSGMPIRMLDKVAFSMYPTGFLDKGSALSQTAFADKVNEIMRAAQADGRMKALSEKYFGTDYATAAAAYDLAPLDQKIP